MKAESALRWLLLFVLFALTAVAFLRDLNSIVDTSHTWLDGLALLAMAYLGLTRLRLEASHDKQKRMAADLEFQKFALDRHAIVSMTDARGDIIEANDKFCEISGYTREELLGRNHRILKSGKHAADFYAEMWKTISAGKVWEGEVCNKAKDGSLYWVHSTVVPCPDEHGKPWRYISIRTDITTLKATKDHLEENRQFLRSITDAMGEGVYALDAQGRTTFLNFEAENLLGWTQDELLGKSLHDIVHFQQADGTPIPAANCPMHIATSHGQMYRGKEETFTTRTGEMIPVAMVATPLLNDHGVTGSVGVFRDIREQKQLHAELEQARDQALNASRLKSEFLSTMSHEIRTPMNGVIGMTDLLLDTQLDARQREFADIIKDSANALLSIINDILDFSKIEAGKMEIEHIEFTLLPVVEGSLDILAGKAREKGLMLMSHVDPAIPANVIGDPGRLRQILLNLAGNAIKFTPSGEVIVRAISLGNEGELHRLRFEISDTGIGLSPEVVARLFQPFTQADGSITRKYGGTGLGLSISRRLVELMGGKMGLDSELGQGSTFWLEVCMAKGQRPALPTTARDFSGTGVLVVAPSRTQREILLDYLKIWGIHATAATDGGTALQLLQQDNTFNIAIIADRLPDTEIHTLLRDLRGINHHIRPILLAETDAARREAAEHGFSGALLQPIRQSSLFDAMMQAMDRRQQNTLVQQDLRATPSAMANTASMAEPILLVEDNAVNQKIALNLIGKLGYAAQIANNGQEALDMLTHQPYGLILMDCQMPIMDGFEATHAIRKQEAASRQHIPIIAMTANAMQGDRERCLEAGMDDYLSKPITPQALSAMLEKWLSPENRPPSSSAAPGAMPDIIDMARLTDMFGDDTEIIDELLTVFLSTTAPLLDKLKIAIDRADFQEIRAIGHQIAGAAGNLGISPLHTLGKAAEQAAIQNDIGQARRVHASMLEAFGQTSDFVKHHLTRINH